MKVLFRPFASVLVLCAVSCGSIHNNVVIRDKTRLVVDASQVADHYPDLAGVNEAAILSAATYDDPTWDVTPSLAAYCRSSDGLAFDASSLGWVEELNLPAPRPAPDGVRLVRGLKYRVWVKRTGDETATAMVAFRGTQSASDWYSNLRWVTRFVPNTWDHYEQLERVVPTLIETIRERHGAQTRIIAAGHSLGGGLSQMFGYASDGAVKTVFAFDPSSVTYFASLPKALTTNSTEGQSIYRVFEQGEVLSYVRWVVKRFRAIKHENPRIVQVKYHLLGGGLIRNHSMRKFACASRAVAANRTTQVAGSSSR